MSFSRQSDPRASFLPPFAQGLGVDSPSFPLVSFDRPGTDRIRAFLASQETLPFTYPEHGASRTFPLPDTRPLEKKYKVIHHRFHLGRGMDTFHRARRALLRWEMFQLGWVLPCWADTPQHEGTIFGILSRVMGVWTVQACRILLRFDDPVENATGIARCGVAYGTTPGHAIMGEERLSVEWNPLDQSVTYEIYSFSRESQLLVKIVGFHLRAVQKRFGEESYQAMIRAANTP
ncbi:MAG: DUF1990 domain-containing protein [Magnetococcales bacterium]|nr:DUF1990 domain-containing protein [Magnetococcales bacterium]